MGQCVLNDHLRKQACKIWQRVKKKRRICFDSSSIPCFCMSVTNESLEHEAINFINQQKPSACRSIMQNKHMDVEEWRALSLSETDPYH